MKSRSEYNSKGLGNHKFYHFLFTKGGNTTDSKNLSSATSEFVNKIDNNTIGGQGGPLRKWY
jgi:hypothetical protein